MPSVSSNQWFKSLPTVDSQYPTLMGNLIGKTHKLRQEDNVQIESEAEYGKYCMREKFSLQLLHLEGQRGTRLETSM